MEIVRQVLAIVFVFGLLGAAVWALRRKGFAPRCGLPAGKRRAARLTVVDRAGLSPQHGLHLVRLGDRALLIAAHPAGCTVLEAVPWETVARPAEVELQ
jgi:flagellar biogenesis protein FliO